MMTGQNRTMGRIYVKPDINALGERERRVWNGALCVARKSASPS